MILKSAVAIIAALAALSQSIAPALSYYPSQVGASSSERPSLRASSSRSSRSSSIMSTSTSVSNKPTVVSQSATGSSMSSSSAQSSSSVASVKPSAQASCILLAVEKRETAIGSSLDQFHATMEELLTLRKDLLLRYWAVSDTKKRASSIKTVWRTFGQSWRKTGNLMREQRRIAWETFRDERSACGVYDLNDPEMGGLGADSY